MLRPPDLSVQLIPWLLLLGSCSSPPKPPTVDEGQKRPANSAMAVELQTCRHDLQNTRILAAESERAAGSAIGTIRQITAHANPASSLPSGPLSNSVYSVRFDFGSTRVSIPQEMRAALIDEARSAPLIVLKGRTDGTTDGPAESRIARVRAAAVRDYLVDAGINAARIRMTYQPIGDYVADNRAAFGRAVNRRVEIEIYRAVPIAAGAAPASPVSPN